MPALEKRRVGGDVLVEVDTFGLAVTAYLTYLSWCRHDLSWIHLLAIPHAMIDTILGCMRVGVPFSIQPAIDLCSIMSGPTYRVGIHFGNGSWHQ